jgi:tRNA U34 2-thiouridine synthase MnmA/TrmU
MWSYQAEVRQWATALGLPNQARPDSQGICFLGKVRFADFLARHLGTWPGAFLEAESGRVLGYHQGFWFYTQGQRKGVHLSGGPWCRHCLSLALFCRALAGPCRTLSCSCGAWKAAIGP